MPIFPSSCHMETIEQAVGAGGLLGKIVCACVCMRVHAHMRTCEYIVSSAGKRRRHLGCYQMEHSQQLKQSL